MIFVCDVMLGKLARYLRMLGFDTRYIRQGDDRASFPAPSPEALFLTKKRTGTLRSHTRIVHGNDPEEQLLEISDSIEPYIDSAAFMTRCLDCNTLLIDVPKDEIEPFVPEYVYHHQDRFTTCPSCKKVYWEGSHAHEMHAWMQRVRSKE
jgi:uncharacterized protein with PIN domain